MLTYARVCSRMLQVGADEALSRATWHTWTCTYGWSVQGLAPKMAQVIPADVCSRMLTYAHVCSRTLTYADARETRPKNGTGDPSEFGSVCSRMLTYADVC